MLGFLIHMRTLIKFEIKQGSRDSRVREFKLVEYSIIQL